MKNLRSCGVLVCLHSVHTFVARLWVRQFYAVVDDNCPDFKPVGGAIQHSAFSCGIDCLGRVRNRHQLRPTNLNHDQLGHVRRRRPVEHLGGRNETADDIPHASARGLGRRVMGGSGPDLHDRRATRRHW